MKGSRLMKRILAYTMSMAVLVMMLTGCGLLDSYAHFVANNAATDRKFKVEGYDITLTASKEWEKSADTSFDLQIGNGSSYLSIMAYDKIDLAERETPEDIYDWHNEDLFSRRDNVKLVEEPVTYTSNGKVITRTMYSAERDGVKNYYCSCLVTFEDDEDVFAWVILTGTPSYLVDHRDDILEIVDTMACN